MAIGILLPVLETVRRGISHWAVDFSTMFEDYSAGALLLAGAWAAMKSRSWGVLLLVVSWTWVTEMMTNSFMDQVEGTLRKTVSEPYNLFVLLIKFLLWGLSLISLLLALQRAYRQLLRQS